MKRNKFVRQEPPNLTIVQSFLGRLKLIDWH